MRETKIYIWKTGLLQESTHRTAYNSSSEVCCAMCYIRSASNLRVKENKSRIEECECE
jgi:hypothetical protein